MGKKFEKNGKNIGHTAVGLNLVQTYLILLNPELNFRSGSAKVLNFELNFGLVLKGSGSNFGSGLNFSNTTPVPMECPVHLSVEI